MKRRTLLAAISFPPASSSTNPPDPARFPVLVTEDDPAIRGFAAQVLRKRGYRVLEAADGESALSALAQLEEEASPILVLDKNLPGKLNGLDVLERVREIRDDFDVVLMSAFVDVGSLKRSMDLGIFRCVSKPFHIDELAGAVAGAANRLSLRLDLRQRKVDLEIRNAELERTVRRLKDEQDRRALTERLAAVGQFAATLAHELGNPMAYVQTNLSALRLQAEGCEAALRKLGDGASWDALSAADRAAVLEMARELPGVLDECEEGLKLMRTISRDLGTVSRCGPATEEAFDVNDVVRSASRIAKVDPTTGAKVELALCSAPLRMRGSPGTIAQVVMNLLGNAAQATAPGRPNHIVVRTWEEGSRVGVEVTDTGVGIPQERLAKIFEPFVTFRPEDGGTGLGLAIVRSVVEEHDGEIHVESEVGRGTSFRVTFPSAPASTARLRIQRDLSAGELAKRRTG